MIKSHHYLVDKNHPLPSWYVPTDLVEAPIPFMAPSGNPKRLICAVAYDALYNLYQDSLSENLKIFGISAYRSFTRQQEIYNESIQKNGIKHTQMYIAYPGTSEHQTGLAIDLSTPEIDYDLIEAFADTKEGQWLEQNAKNYMFRISYPRDAKKFSGYNYEPWHIFYTGSDTVYFL